MKILLGFVIDRIYLFINCSVILIVIWWLERELWL